jgi:iron complex outermembrane recepter protein
MRMAVVAAATCISVVGLAAGINADAAMRRPTNIPAEPLRPALQTLSRDRNFQVVYRTDLVGDVRTQGASGDLTLDEALTARRTTWRFQQTRQRGGFGTRGLARGSNN